MTMMVFTPGGVEAREPEDDVATVATGTINAADAVANLREKVAALEATRPQGKRAAVQAQAAAVARVAPSSVLKPRSFVKELRTRLRAVEREIKMLRRLEDEAAELRRLIAAASEPAKVINLARKSG